MYVLELAGQDDAFAACEAESAATGVSLVGAGLATARAVTDRLDGLAYTRRASELVGTGDPSVASAATLLRASSLDREGSVAVRAVDVRSTTGVDTQRVERVLGDVLVERGLTVDLDDPDHELRALFAGPPESDGRDGDSGDSGSGDGDGGDSESGDGGSGDSGDGEGNGPEGVCVLGWLTHAAERAFGDRKPSDRPFVQPGSMDPLLARALVNIAGARSGGTLLDPMCGTGGLLLEGALVGARVVGVDAQTKMVEGTRRNLRAFAPDATVGICRGDATRLPVADDAADAAVVDVPYGRQSKIEAASLAGLVGGALAELRRVAPRAVVVGDRSWAAAARETGWRVERSFERRVHRSLVRHVLVLERSP